MSKPNTSLVHEVTITTYAATDKERKNSLVTSVTSVIGESATTVANLSIWSAYAVQRNANTARELLAQITTKRQKAIEREDHR